MSYKESDLVLQVSKNVNPTIWDEGFFQVFLDLVFKNRPYQKDATEIALRFLNSGEYSNITELAKENYDKNPVIRERWNNNFDSLINDLDMSDKLSATLDLATGTGKSYVMFAISLIMLASKKVNRVLILVPSLTIESELTQKFKDLLSNDQYIKSLGSDFIPPLIVNGNSTIVENSIAIENRDAIYKAQESRNSIVDSLKGNGEKTLVLNDEVHHVYYSDKNQWKSFINDERKSDIDFKYVIGVTGTPYKRRTSTGTANEYFSNVIYRFSLREAIEQGFVKDIEYISKEDIPKDKNERWQVILNSHDEISDDIPEELGIKPITIIVTDRQNTAESKAKQFKNFLKNQRSLSDEEVNEIVLCVHSGAKAAVDRLKLKNVNQKGNPVEFIFSVSMLTEGWDVKRVFQIVPDEERAFNSKLLIAQVLGRGLRIPDEWKSQWGVPTVRVFNHEKWSANVKALVDEILQIRKTITIHVNSDSEFNFTLMNVEYASKEDTKDYPKLGSYNLWENGVKLPTDAENGKSNITLSNVKTSSTRDISSQFKHELFTVQQVAETLYHRFEDIPDKSYIKEYQALWTVEKISKMIEDSLEKSGNKVITKSLRNKFLNSMNVIFRDGSKVVTYTTIPTQYREISTRDLPKSTNDLAGFQGNKTLYYGAELKASLTDDASKVSLVEISDPSNGYKHFPVENKYLFKTPQFGIVTSGTPEKLFLSNLIEEEIARSIDAFVKSDDMNFYRISYVWQKGTHHKTGQFNPDWFIKQGDTIIVVETKDDSQLIDPDPENIGKNKAALKHFTQINKYYEQKGEKTRYKFNFLTPKDYSIFFEKLKSNESINYFSNLDAKLDE
ncbi:DEAD/DEAH box helicase [Lactococcus formosensis]|uniref:DEAD/DEAH box helicase n=1 Tax=Lactococcus formosensis TaxID=1281486 RepID=UPI00254D7F48|nr:DEAD/DEAH box helicase family protein [Lactococcus formosensis]